MQNLARFVLELQLLCYSMAPVDVQWGLTQKLTKVEVFNGQTDKRTSGSERHAIGTASLGNRSHARALEDMSCNYDSAT